MNHDHVILGVIDGVGDLRRCQPDIDRMQNRTKHRDGEERLEIPMRVPVHHRNDTADTDTLRGKSGPKALQPCLKVAIAVSQQPVTDDLGIRRDLLRCPQQCLDQERKIRCIMRGWHGCLSSMGKTVSAGQRV